MVVSVLLTQNHKITKSNSCKSHPITTQLTAHTPQTISIAKAGITTVLNSRASVLAAANPIFGRYDDLRSAGENIDLMTTILSRFDLIFIVRDIRDEERDKAIARHVMGIHVNSKQDGGGQGQGGVGVGISNENGEGGSLIMDTHGSDGKGSGGGGNASASTVGENAAKVAANGGDLDIPTMKKVSGEIVRFIQFFIIFNTPRTNTPTTNVTPLTNTQTHTTVRPVLPHAVLPQAIRRGRRRPFVRLREDPRRRPEKVPGPRRRRSERRANHRSAARGAGQAEREFGEDEVERGGCGGGRCGGA